MKYIFYTEEGHCENNDGEVIENFQILGTSNGNNLKQAYKNLLKENEWIVKSGFKETHIFGKMIMPDDIKESLEIIIKYLWNDEKKHYEESVKKDKDNHIFKHIKKVKKYLV